MDVEKSCATGAAAGAYPKREKKTKKDVTCNQIKYHKILKKIFLSFFSIKLYSE